MGKINGLDIFSGIGGITLALQEFIVPIAYCEIEPYCQSVLLSRMQEGHLPKAPIWDDIRTLSGSHIHLPIDIIYGGFPCQDISIAGNGKGLEGKRSGLFFEILRLAKEIKPTFLFLENVPAITTRGGLRVVKEIASLGYDCRWCIISAASVGALHKRERWFLLANAINYGTFTNKERKSLGECSLSRQRSQEQTQSVWKIERTSCLYSNVANSSSKSADRYSIGKEKTHSMFGNSSNDGNTYGITSKQTNSKAFSDSGKPHSWGRYSRFYWPFASRDDWQKTVSEMGKCSDGLSNHVDRLKALGNSVVPQQVKKAFQILTQLKS